MERIPAALQAIYQEYPWLHYHPNAVTDYLPPNYYDKVLKPYTFGGKSDLEFFLESVNNRFNPPMDDVLEMGSGSGRATDALLNSRIGYRTIDLVDISHDMVAETRGKYANVPGLSVFESDIIDYLQATSRTYSYAYSLWGFSYSVHHHMNGKGIRAGGKHSEGVITKFVTQNLTPGGSMFIVHPDILSDEQRIIKSLRQPTVSKTMDRQSSSKRLLDSLLEKLEKLDLVKADCTHLGGDPIRYSSIDEALEIFLNFHLHGTLNRSRRLPDAIDTLKKEFAHYQNGDEIFISPGCFNYSVTSQSEGLLTSDIS